MTRNLVRKTLSRRDFISAAAIFGGGLALALSPEIARAEEWVRGKTTSWQTPPGTFYPLFKGTCWGQLSYVSGSYVTAYGTIKVTPACGPQSIRCDTQISGAVGALVNSNLMFNNTETTIMTGYASTKDVVNDQYGGYFTGTSRFDLYIENMGWNTVTWTSPVSCSMYERTQSSSHIEPIKIVSESNQPMTYVTGTNGLLGYVFDSDLAGDFLTTPEDALAYCKEHDSFTIPVYEKTGINQIDTFIVSCGITE